MRDFFRIAWVSLRKRSLRSWLTMLGVIIGIAAVVSLVSLGQGMQDAINAQFASVGTDKIIVSGADAGFGPPGQNTAGTIGDRDLRLVRNTPGVDRAAPRLLRSVSVDFADEVQVLFASGLPQDSDERDLVLDSLNVDVDKGRLLKSSERGKIMVGYDLWSKEQFPKKIELGSRVIMNGKSFDVVGLLGKGGAFGSDAVFINDDDLSDLLDIGDELSAIVAQIVPGENVDQVAERINRKIRRDRGQKEGFEDFKVETSQELIDSINVILGVVQAVFIGIAMISLLVGGIGIMNTMYTSVLERTREIGIMKAIGARNGDVLSLFLIESGLLGMVGGAIGVAIGIAMSKFVEVVGQQVMGDLLRASFSPTLIIGALAFSFFIGALSGVLPALQASRMQPVDALRQ